MNFEAGPRFYIPLLCKREFQRGYKKGSFEEFGPNSWFEAPQIKEESQKRKKNDISVLLCPRDLLWTRQP